MRSMNVKIAIGYSISVIGQIMTVYEPSFTTAFETLAVLYKTTVAI